jgi:calcium-dependent protein kinase
MGCASSKVTKTNDEEVKVNQINTPRLESEAKEEHNKVEESIKQPLNTVEDKAVKNPSLTVSKIPESPKKVVNEYQLKLNKATLIKYNSGLISQYYKLLDILGQGSFGTVYKCKYILTGEERALKKINRKTVQKLEDLGDEDLPNELKIHCLIDHPHIIKTYEYFKDEKNYYIVTELVEGGSLIDMLKSQKFIDEQKVAAFIEQLLSCIYYLHSNKIVHRDLKPDNTLLNIRLDNDVNTKLIDFGMATTYDDNKMMDLLCGTAYYIAPEVIQECYTHKCDLWSIGCMMYFLLCGKPPFYGQSPYATFDKILNEQHDFNGKGWALVSESAKDLINKLLEKSVNKRPSAEEALNHPWFKEIKGNPSFGKGKIEILPDYKENLQKFLGKNLLEQACAAYVLHHTSHIENEKELTKLFKLLDKSNDGRLTIHELQHGYKEHLKDPFLDAHADEIFKHMDSDGDNFIEFEEFMRASAKISNNYSKAIWAEAFRHYDVDGSGKISSDELKNILSSDKKDKNQILKDLITKIDINRDGEVSFDEFLAMLNH